MNGSVGLVLVTIFVIIGQINGWSMTTEEFQKCAAAFNHGTPSESIAHSFIDQAHTHGNITSKLEALIAISQLAWESIGFSVRSEFACSNGHWSTFPCDSYDTKGCPKNKKYYGRGFIQLTHCFNYKEAEKDFPGIVEDPDQVATNDTIAMGTALFYWRTHVHNEPGVQHGHFGSATKAINGMFECTPGNYTLLARERWNRFNACLKAIGMHGHMAKEEGCYHGTTILTIPSDVDSKPGNCRSIEEPQYNQWCSDDCPHGNCPATVCKCGSV